ncbi:hypothetical protein [Microlunatus parietis]|uniref:Uncharacterized protein n=1 Tax=Microlunatus parietis TaxID=682979 RepID=A0A7Y9I636_9ACTN|nr:hypothetical protein [Microlunatus parietis]NYE70968.1 hypothetical protein [Microlunatus parietis]
MSSPSSRLAKPRRRWGRLTMGIGACVVLVGVITMIIVVATGQSNRLLTPRSADPEVFHLLDTGGRVSVELPTTWWDTTARDAGETVSDDTGDWLVAALSAASDAPRELAVWLDDPSGAGDGLTEPHAEFLAATCSDGGGCTAEAVASVAVDGRPGLRQTLRFDDGHRGVITTIPTDQLLIFVLAEGPDTDDAAAELLKISDSVRVR